MILRAPRLPAGHRSAMILPHAWPLTCDSAARTAWPLTGDCAAIRERGDIGSRIQRRQISRRRRDSAEIGTPASAARLDNEDLRNLLRFVAHAQKKRRPGSDNQQSTFRGAKEMPHTCRPGGVPRSP